MPALLPGHKSLNSSGRAGLLGLAPPPPDPLPQPPPRVTFLLEALPRRPRLEIRVRDRAAFRAALGVARPGDRVVYHEGDAPLADARELDDSLGPLADEVLAQSDARDVPLRSACRHIRGRLNGQGRCRLHVERGPHGEVRCVAVRA